MVQLAVWLGALLPFATAAAVLKQVGGLEITQSCLWRRTQAWGAKLDEANTHVRVAANATPDLWTSPVQHRSEQRGAPHRMGVGMDGAIINIRREGWKELKFACLFDVAVRTEEDPVTHETVPMGHALKTTCVTHLGGPETLGEMAWAEAQRRGWEAAAETIAIADGAPWIWNQVGLHFGDSLQLVDWYHAQSHLYAAARGVHEEGSAAGQRWLKAHTMTLYQGHADKIAQALRKLAIERPGQGDSGLRRRTALAARHVGAAGDAHAIFDHRSRTVAD